MADGPEVNAEWRGLARAYRWLGWIFFAGAVVGVIPSLMRVVPTILAFFVAMDRSSVRSAAVLESLLELVPALTLGVVGGMAAAAAKGIECRRPWTASLMSWLNLFLLFIPLSGATHMPFQFGGGSLWPVWRGLNDAVLISAAVGVIPLAAILYHQWRLRAVIMANEAEPKR